MSLRLSLTALALVAVGGAPAPAQAARSYDNCTGFITSLPAVISTQGTWCMDRDLSSGLSMGTAITIAANNVTLDCNDFKLGGLAAGPETQANGILANNRSNVTVRNCNVRGYFSGITLQGAQSSGHAVEDNRLDGNTAIGIFLFGEGSVVRRNRIFDTGGTPYPAFAVGVDVRESVDVIDNVIFNVASSTAASGTSADGIYTEANYSGRIQGNRVAGVASSGGPATAILVNFSPNAWLVGNHLVAATPGNGIGLSCLQEGPNASGNFVAGFMIANSGCTDGGGNILP